MVRALVKTIDVNKTCTNDVCCANYTVLDNDCYGSINITTGACDRTITLPTVACNIGRKIQIFKTDCSAPSAQIIVPL